MGISGRGGELDRHGVYHAPASDLSALISGALCGQHPGLLSISFLLNLLPPQGHFHASCFLILRPAALCSLVSVSEPFHLGSP